MSSNNMDIRVKMVENGIQQWKVAEEIGIHPSYLSFLLRYDLKPDRRNQIETAIAKLKNN